MADLDVDSLLRDLARDAGRRSRLAAPTELRRSADPRRLAKGIGVGAGLVILTTGTFGLMNGAMGSAIVAAQSDAASGATAPPRTSDRAARVSPSDVVLPPVPTWAPTPPTLPLPTTATVAVPAPAPPAAPPRTETTGPTPSSSTPTATGSTPTATGSTPTATGTPSTGPSAQPTPSGTPSGSGTTGTTGGGTPTTGSPAAPTNSPTAPIPTPSSTAPAPAVLATYQVSLYNAVVGGRIGERVGDPEAFSNPSGTLPYPHRLATIVVGGVSAPPDKPVAVAVGVDRDGGAHLTFFTDGKVSGDQPVALPLGDAAGLVAVGNPTTRELTLLVFGAGGTVSRVVIGEVGLGRTPTLGAPVPVASGLSGTTAATLAERSANGSITAYVVAGDTLRLVTVPASGAASVLTVVPNGLAGTTMLGRVSAGGAGGRGVGAWSTDGSGSLYYSADPAGALALVGPATPLPR